jgi:hypothetical protein
MCVLHQTNTEYHGVSRNCTTNLSLFVATWQRRIDSRIKRANAIRKSTGYLTASCHGIDQHAGYCSIRLCSQDIIAMEI